ncbi:hypothetical protein BTO32_13685 [Marinobacter lutaoensis]|uniref:Lipoprotein n=1 Tax=Marinobacter lutaoensis TaxID=135739 RepID=A0A1V2DQ32_9GAMM|nr:hypothetical protein [Marinobacter lutaoensis]ONF42738.1 hypothetical protein BTO32_13685 [Marinobacter lutaoensis]
MRRLRSLSLSLLMLALAGCGGESDTPPVDGRDFDGVSYSLSAPYGGRVIDGYLEQARVWLDLDGDSQYTGGPLTLTLDNGNLATLPSGEPTALSGPDGVFELDVSELALPSRLGPDLDPRDYPLYALAMPGKTWMQTHAGLAPVSRAFLMSAGPGVRNVTPLTTLARYRALAGLGPYFGVADNLSANLGAVNLLRDYVLAGDERAHAYARALARFMASQVPEGYNALLAQPDSDGRERYLSDEAAYLLGVSLVQNAPEVLARVDDAAQGNYANVDTENLVLPDVPVALDNPVLLTHLTVRAESEHGHDLPVNRSDLLVSAELTFDYTEDGRLLAISAHGCLAPDMAEMARLIRVDGYMARLDSQWRPSAVLSRQSRVAYDTEGVDERLLFDWDAGRAYFETRTACHDHQGIPAGSSELGGEPEARYQWQVTEAGDVSLQASLPGGTVTYVAHPADPPADADGFTLSQDGIDLATVVFTGEGRQCQPLDADIASRPLVVTTQYGYDVTGYDPQPTSFSGLALEYDDRPLSGLAATARPLHRLLRYGFLDPALSELDNVSGDGSFEWLMYYPGAEALADPDNPNLIREAYLQRYTGARACGRAFENAPIGAYAKLEYGYQRLSEYLVERLE